MKYTHNTAIPDLTSLYFFLVFQSIPPWVQCQFVVELEEGVRCFFSGSAFIKQQWC
jgi:hypothetical protein